MLNGFQRYLVFFIFFQASLALSQDLEVLADAFTHDPKLSKAKFSFLAIDLITGDTLLSVNPNQPLVTASTTKLFSTAMAMEVLGLDYRFETKIFQAGSRKDTLIMGDLWVQGGGDVSFGSRYFNAEGSEFDGIKEWADTLLGLGIKCIKGNVYIDGSSFGYEGAPKGWSAWDAGNYYGAVPAGINVFDNVTRYFFSTGKPGTKAKLLSMVPPQKSLVFTNKIVSAKVTQDHSNLQGLPYDWRRTGTGKLPAYQSSYMVRGSVPDPEKNVADVFSEYIKEKGIVLSGEVIPFRTAKVNPPDYDNLKILYSVAGRSVKEIIEWTNLKSVNFFAEGLLKGVAFKLTGKGTHENGIQVYRQYLSQRIDTSGLVLYDGSGLSRMNRISASHMFELLRYVDRSSFAQDFKQTLPIAGKTGTIRDLCVGQIGEGRVYAKSGTMTGIKSYAGYIDAVSGRKIAFSLIASDYSCSQSVVKTYMESIFNGLAGL